jgi:hypothetical protein
MTAVFPADVGTEMVSGQRPFSSIHRASAHCQENGFFFQSSQKNSLKAGKLMRAPSS